ncbi:MAG: Fic family protein [Anaerolineae bacterium]
MLNLDEYERLEEMLADGRIDRRILNLLHNLTQHHPQVVVLLSGSHTPQDMPAYWSDYLINFQLLHVSYLEEDEARELVEEPVPDFPLRYDEEAVTRILSTTRGQPFLVQATCQRLVDLVNRKRRQHATLADAEAALEALVTAEDTLYVPPAAIEVPPLMHELVTWLNSDEAAELHPVARAALAHFRLVHVHPFIDGNGRTARLLMNLILLREGFPPAVIRRERRPEYYHTLDRAHEGDTDPFVILVAEEAEQSLDVWLQAIPAAGM